MDVWYPKLTALLKEYGIKVWGPIVIIAKDSIDREFPVAVNAVVCQPLEYLKATSPDVYDSCAVIAVSPVAAVLMSHRGDLPELVIGNKDIDQFVRNFNESPDLCQNKPVKSVTMVDKNIAYFKGRNIIVTLRGLYGIWCQYPAQTFTDANNEMLEIFDILHAVDAALPQPIAEEIRAFFH